MSMQAFRRMVEVVARVAGTTYRAVLSIGRQRVIVHARHVVAWLIRNVFGMSFPDVAHALRLLDHTSAMHACRQVDRELREGKGRRAELLFEVMGALTMEAA